MEVVAPEAAAEQTYTTRALIVGLPASGRSYLELHHENIPTFVGRDGQVEGMPVMVMDFPSIHPSVSLAEFAVGDKVEVTFEVRWKSDPRSLVTRLTKLPADTPLTLTTTPGGN